MDYFRDVGKDFDLNEWINMSGLKDPSPAQAAIFAEDLNKIGKLGMLDQPDGKGGASWLNTLNACRLGMLVSWGVVVGGAVFLAVTAPVALVFWGPIGIAANWGIQKALGWFHNQRFEATFTEIRREMKEAGSMQAGVAWAGVMHKYLQHHKPLMLFPNQTKFFNFQESNSVDAVLRQLRQAAQFGSNKIGVNPGNSATPFFRDPFFDNMLKQNDHALDELFKRGMKFATNSAKLSNPLPLMKRLIFGK